MTPTDAQGAGAVNDPVNHPSHYASTRIECIDALEAMVEHWPGEAALLGGNIVKYIWRWRDKGGVESLRKARWYLDRLITFAERAALSSPSAVSPKEGTP